MSTINTTINHGIVLGTPGYYSPLSITAAGYVSNGGTGPAIFGGTGTVVNDGRVVATGTDSGVVGNVAILLSDSGSTVINHGTITGAGYAVDLYSAGSLDNSGTVYGGR